MSAGNQAEEVFIQYNNKIPEFSTDRWKYPSHKVSVVHAIPCCKNIAVRHKDLGAGIIYTLTDEMKGGRGLWQSPQGGVIFFHIDSDTWQVGNIHLFGYSKLIISGEFLCNRFSWLGLFVFICSMSWRCS